MGSITPEHFQAMVTRLERNKLRAGDSPVPDDAVSKEIEELHYPIIKWCKDNRAAYIRARSDIASTIAKGCPDFSIFYQGKILLVECKSRTGKLKPEQLGWKMLAEMNNFEVHVVRSMSEFMELVK